MTGTPFVLERVGFAPLQDALQLGQIQLGRLGSSIQVYEVVLQHCSLGTLA